MRGLAAVMGMEAMTAALPPDMAAQESAAEVARTAEVRLYSDPWMNLHHFLYQWAKAEEGIGTGRQEVPVPEREQLDRLGGEQRVRWRAAVDFYRANLAEQGHFSDDMLEAKDQLLRRRGGDDVPLPDVVPGQAGHLEAAMGVYEKSWWPEHDAANRAWIARITPLIRSHEGFYVGALEKAMGGRWEHPIPVDVSGYANWAGGYTSLGPDHTTV